ncbi:MAG: ABC transporter ATP-binding protein [Dehalococcoidia bacterium]
MLEIRDLVAAYGPVTALRGVNVSVRQGTTVTILGANGAGKSTILRAISGLLKPARGSIQFDGERIDHKSAASIVRRGISLVPEGRQLFTALTVEQNLRLGAFTRSDRRAVREDLLRVYDYFPRLRERMKQFAGSLSGGEQQMLAIGRALMAHPRLLLLDEPSTGLAPFLVRDIFKIVSTINREQGTTVLLVEQNATLSLSIADYGYVIETGRVVIEAPAHELREDEAVRKAYLGY